MQYHADLVALTKEILYGKLLFCVCSDADVNINGKIPREDMKSLPMICLPLRRHFQIFKGFNLTFGDISKRAI